MKIVLIVSGVFLVMTGPAPLLAQSSEDIRFTRFDSLFHIAGHGWVSGSTGTIANRAILDVLAGLYPEGITHEQVGYEGKHNNTTDRWIVVRGVDCNVFEYKRWEWGGVFGFINGVNVLDIKDFKSRLEREVGKVDLGE